MSKERGAAKQESGGSPEWMTTYADLVTLLMCFFVLLFAFSTIDNQKFAAVMQSFQGSAGVLESGVSLSPSDLIFDGLPESQQSSEQEPLKQQQEVEALKEALKEFQKQKDMDYDIQVEGDSRGLKITFPDNVLFDPGRADIKASAHELLNFMSDLLTEEAFVDRFIRVEGHTDNVPINTVQFPSNWELSTGRASRVVRYFIEVKQMDQMRFAPLGYGELRPIASNETVEGRAKNRRVDVVVLTSEEQEKEPVN